VNDAFFHGSIPTFQFGGVGDSGQGSYRGQASFDVFTHRRSITTTPNWMEKLLDVRYPPYAGKLAKFRQSSELKPNFDRNGNEIRGVKYWLGVILGMGGDGASSVFKRWAVAVILAVGAKRYADGGKFPSYLK
jgi:beta-apo-4'-carotenal oxygenase